MIRSASVLFLHEEKNKVAKSIVKTGLMGTLNTVKVSLMGTVNTVKVSLKGTVKKMLIKNAVNFFN